MILNTTEFTRLLSGTLLYSHGTQWHPNESPKIPMTLSFSKPIHSRKLTNGYPKWWAVEKYCNSLYKHGNFWISMLDFRRITFGSSGCSYVTCLIAGKYASHQLASYVMLHLPFEVYCPCELVQKTMVTPINYCVYIYIWYILLHCLMTFPSPHLHHHAAFHHLKATFFLRF